MGNGIFSPISSNPLPYHYYLTAIIVHDQQKGVRMSEQAGRLPFIKIAIAMTAQSLFENRVKNEWSAACC
jgi:hypothetical protein